MTTQIHWGTTISRATSRINRALNYIPFCDRADALFNAISHWLHTDDDRKEWSQDDILNWIQLVAKRDLIDKYRRDKRTTVFSNIESGMESEAQLEFQSST